MFDLFSNRDYNLQHNSKKTMTHIEEANPDELFRVGATRFGDTTLTILGNDGLSVTLTLSQTRCEQMIRMLRATYYQEQPTEGDDNADA